MFMRDLCPMSVKEILWHYVATGKNVNGIRKREAWLGSLQLQHMNSSLFEQFTFERVRAGLWEALMLWIWVICGCPQTPSFDSSHSGDIILPSRMRKNKTPNFSQLPLILRYTEMSFVLPSIHLWETSPPTLLYFMNRHHVSGNNSCGRHLLLRSSLIVVEAVWFQSQWLYSGFLMQWCMIVTGTSFFGSGNCWEL